jgi:hypothetical protein
MVSSPKRVSYCEICKKWFCEIHLKPKFPYFVDWDTVFDVQSNPKLRRYKKLDLSRNRLCAQKTRIVTITYSIWYTFHTIFSSKNGDLKILQADLITTKIYTAFVLIKAVCSDVSLGKSYNIVYSK